jgi:hypothetical protein
MAESVIQNGIGVVWGVSTSTSGFGTATAFLLPIEEDYRLTSLSLQHFHKIEGYVIGECFYRRESTLRLRLYPCGRTLADAIAANKMTLEIGAELFVTDTDDPALADFWSVIEVGKQHRAADKVYWDIMLRRHGDNFVEASEGGPYRISQVVPL